MRASARKGFFDWFDANEVDVLCIQETNGDMDFFTGPDVGQPGFELVDALLLHDGCHPAAVLRRNNFV